MLLLTGVCPTFASSFLATGDQNNLWVLHAEATDPQAFTIFHRGILDGPDRVHAVVPLRGRVAEDGLAGANGRLWLVYDPPVPGEGHTVQSIGLVSQPTIDLTVHKSVVEAALPPGFVLRALTIGRDGPWALVRDAQPQPPLTDTPTPAAHDAPHTLEKLLKPSQRHPQPPPPPHPPQGPAPPQAAPATTTGTQPTPADRLLKLDRNAWVTVDLPTDWSGSVPTWLIMLRADPSYPHLVSLTPVDGGDIVTVYRHNADGWDKTTHWFPAEQPTTPPPSHTLQDNSPPTRSHVVRAVVLAVDGQLVVGRAVQDGSRLHVSLSVLRPEAVVPLGHLPITGVQPGTWSVVPFGQTIALIAVSQDNHLLWSRMDLQGRLVTPASTPLSTAPTVSQNQAAEYLILITVLMTASVIMYLSWRQSTGENHLGPVKGLVLADLHLRALAGMIDLLPCIVAALFWFQVHPKDLLTHWPGRSGQWHQMLPGFVAILLFILHTMTTEYLTGQSLGKRFMGVRVVDWQGRHPRFWQVVTRNVMKVFDLIAWPLLILPLIGPFRQRLGDLVARTVVVVRRSAATPHDEDDTDKPADRQDGAQP